MREALIRPAVVALGALLAATAAPAQTPSVRADTACRPDHAGLSAHAWLDSAASAMGMTRAGDRVLRYRPAIVRDYADESDRAYPPFALDVSDETRWFDPIADVERVPAGGVSAWKTAFAAYAGTDSAMRPVPKSNASLGIDRHFNPWAVVADWMRDSSVRVLGRCPYLDFERVALTRRAALGDERLLIDPRSYFPLELRTVQWHYFLGPVHAEVRYTAWLDIAPFAYYPDATIELTDGLGSETWTVTPDRAALVPRDSAPALRVPDANAVMAPLFPPRFNSSMPDTVRVGANAFLLVNPAFTSVIALEADTVFLVDATSGEDRARQDSAWIPKLFPGRHPVTLVLLNAVWPHIAGVRFWVASGAKVVGHPLTGALVRRVVARPWVERPDKLASEHARPRLDFREVRDSATLGNGGLELYELSGAANEGTLMAYFPHDRFLWASDRIQDDHQPSLYVTELVRDVQQHGLHPAVTSGPHFRLLPWPRLEALSVPPRRHP